MTSANLIAFFKRCVAVLLFLIVFTTPLSAHAGKTDSAGGHYDHDSGEYHYHHGYPAHSHYDMDGDGRKDCPYNFDDRTGYNSGEPSSSSSSHSTLPSKPSGSQVSSRAPSSNKSTATLRTWIACVMLIILYFSVRILFFRFRCKTRKYELSGLDGFILVYGGGFVLILGLYIACKGV